MNLANRAALSISLMIAGVVLLMLTTDPQAAPIGSHWLYAGFVGGVGYGFWFSAVIPQPPSQECGKEKA